MIPMDPLLTEQTLINLLKNALVHSESTEPVELIITESEHAVTFHVVNYGKGIDSSVKNNFKFCSFYLYLLK